MARVGWRVQSRSTRYETQSRNWPLTAYPTLRRGEYEATRWTHERFPGFVEIIRGDTVGPRLTADTCVSNAAVESKHGADMVVELVGDLMGAYAHHAPDRQGLAQRGGDFLTPRSDDAPMVRYWAMPKHDLYLQVYENSTLQFFEPHQLRSEIVAMPNRATLDPNSPDQPSNRIPTGEPHS